MGTHSSLSLQVVAFPFGILPQVLLGNIQACLGINLCNSRCWGVRQRWWLEYGTIKCCILQVPGENKWIDGKLKLMVRWLATLIFCRLPTVAYFWCPGRKESWRSGCLSLCGVFQDHDIPCAHAISWIYLSGGAPAIIGNTTLLYLIRE